MWSEILNAINFPFLTISISSSFTSSTNTLTCSSLSKNSPKWIRLITFKLPTNIDSTSILVVREGLNDLMLNSFLAGYSFSEFNVLNMFVSIWLFFLTLSSSTCLSFFPASLDTNRWLSELVNDLQFEGAISDVF